MKKGKIYISFLIIVSIFMALLTGCGKSNTKNQKLVKLRLNEVVRSVFYIPMYAAIAEGFFEEEGFDIELSTGQGADKTMQQVLSNNADIGFCGPEQVIYLYNQGREDYAVIFAQLTKRDGSFLVGRQKDESFEWEKLKGKTLIGGRPGGVPEMTLEYVIRSHNLSISYNDEKPQKDVNIITNLAFTATAAAFKSGLGDYVALFEPTGTMLQDEGSGSIVSSIGKESGEIPYTCFFTTKSYMEKNPDTVQKFTNALYKGLLWMENSSDEKIASSIKSFFEGSDEKQLISVIKRYREQDTWSKDLILSEKALSRLEDVIESYQKDLMPSRPPYDKVVNNKFAKEANKTVK